MFIPLQIGLSKMFAHDCFQDIAELVTSAFMANQYTFFKT